MTKERKTGSPQRGRRPSPGPTYTKVNIRIPREIAEWAEETAKSVGEDTSVVWRRMLREAYVRLKDQDIDLVFGATLDHHDE